MNDLRHTVRQLAKTPGFTAVAILTLALGIGLSASSFSTANALLLRTLPYPESWQLVRIFRTSPQSQSLPHAPLAAAGVAAGLVLALGVTRLLSGFLYGVSPFDPPTFLGVPLLLALVAVLACYLPMQRATKVNPIDALRAE